MKTHQTFDALIILILLSLLFGILSPHGHIFFSTKVLSIILSMIPMLAIITMGMGILLILGEFDLSVGSIYASCMMFMVILYTDLGVCPAMSIILALILGCILGLINGLIVTKWGVSSLIATLGTMWIFRGVLLIATDGKTVAYFPENASPIYKSIFAGNIGFIPCPFLWLIFFLIVLWILLNHTKFGNWIFGIGSNKESARMMGINVDKVKILAFMLMGFLAAVAGVIQGTRMSAGAPWTGKMTNLQAIAGSVVGGVSIYGGSGSVIGALIGAIIIQVSEIGLTMIGLSAFYFDVLLGLVIVMAVFINKKILGFGAES